MPLKNYLFLLRDELQRKLGLKTIDAHACKQISIDIFLTDKDYISKSTLMRLFGLLPMRDKCFPPQIIRILCRYIQLSDSAYVEIKEPDNLFQTI